MAKYEEDEEMTVELELMDGRTVNCEVVTILNMDDQDYVALMPLEEEGESTGEEVWFYRYTVDESDPEAEPELGYIDDDEEYEAVADAFDEYLDECAFEELAGEDDD